MARAMVNGLLESGALSPPDVTVSSRTRSRMAPLTERWPEIETTTDNHLAARSDMLFICVRSEQAPAVLDEIRPSLSPSTHVVLVNSGVAIDDIADVAVSKAIPSITIEAGRGVTLIHHGRHVGPEGRRRLERLFSSVGRVMMMDEQRIDTATALTSCGPAFMATFVDLFARSAQERGFSYDEALAMLTETFMGTAMLLDAGRSPPWICNSVATEGGITEKGLEAMRRELPPMFDEMMSIVLREHRRTGREVGGR